MRLVAKPSYKHGEDSGMSLNNSLRGRLLLSVTLGTGLCLILLFALFDTLVDRELYKRFDASLTNRARTAAAFFGARTDVGASSLQQFLPEFNLAQHREFFQVWDEQSRVIARSDASQGTDLARPHSVTQVPVHFDAILPDGHRGRAVAQVFALPIDDPRQSLTVVIMEERDQIDALESTLHMILIAGTLLTLVVTTLLTRFAIARGLRPVERYAHAMANIDPAQPNRAPATDELPSELTPVANQFSSVLNRLAATLERERRFSRDVAHELRTPIAEAKTLAETALASESATVMRKHLHEITAATGELESIVSSLLAIARYEAGIEKPISEPMNIAAEVRRQVDRVGSHAKARNIVLHSELPSEVWVQSDPALLARIVANLVDNSIAHSPEGSIVDVRVIETPLRIVTSNPAPLLDGAMLTQLGQRFVRAASVANGNYHAGLGLALSNTIARALDLNVGLRKVEGNLEVTVSGFDEIRSER
jgi:signal transduction histidine kinase